MYEGYMTFDGTEVINMERLMAYVDAGIVPAGVDVEDCTGTCDGLGEAVGDAAYTSPMQDSPPWFDEHNPDTVDFAGVLPLEVTGMDGSTRTVEVVPLLTRGGVPMRPSYPPRTVAVSTILIGRTSAGVESGLRWLENVLHRTCTDAPACSTGADLVAFTSCPTPICPGGVGTDQPLDSTSQPWSPDTWLVSGGHAADPDTFLSDAARLFSNWFPNPSAEYGVTGWHKDPTAGNAAWGTATVAQGSLPTDPAKNGLHSHHITFTALAGQPSAQTMTVTGLTPGNWYTFEVWVYAATGNTVEPYVANGATNVIAEAVPVANTWTRRVVSFQAAASSVEAGVRTVGVNSAVACYLDQILLTGMNGAGIQRSDFEAGTTPWAPTTLGGTLAAGAVSASPDQHVTGLQSLKITWGPLNLGRWDDVDPAVTWDTVDPPTVQWNAWPTDTP